MHKITKKTPYLSLILFLLIAVPSFAATKTTILASDQIQSYDVNNNLIICLIRNGKARPGDISNDSEKFILTKQRLRKRIRKLKKRRAANIGRYSSFTNKINKAKRKIKKAVRRCNIGYNQEQETEQPVRGFCNVDINSLPVQKYSSLGVIGETTLAGRIEIDGNLIIKAPVVLSGHLKINGLMEIFRETTILPCTTIEFGKDSKIWIFGNTPIEGGGVTTIGSLNILGEKDKEVLITSQKNSSTDDYWEGVDVLPGAALSNIKHTKFENMKGLVPFGSDEGKSVAFEFSENNFSITDSTINNVSADSVFGSYVVVSSQAGPHNLKNITMSNIDGEILRVDPNLLDGIENLEVLDPKPENLILLSHFEPTVQLRRDLTIRKHTGINYLLEAQANLLFSGLILDEGVTLSAEPGVTIYMGPLARIFIANNSAIDFQGTVDNPINILHSPFTPDTYSSSTPHPDSFFGFVFRSASAYSEIRNVNFTYDSDTRIFSGSYPIEFPLSQSSSTALVENVNILQQPINFDCGVAAINSIDSSGITVTGGNVGGLCQR